MTLWLFAVIPIRAPAATSSHIIRAAIKVFLDPGGPWIDSTPVSFGAIRKAAWSLGEHDTFAKGRECFGPSHGKTCKPGGCWFADLSTIFSRRLFLDFHFLADGPHQRLRDRNNGDSIAVQPRRA
jgi:hypothetical protein